MEHIDTITFRFPTENQLRNAMDAWLNARQQQNGFEVLNTTALHTFRVGDDTIFFAVSIMFKETL